jgi:hypothetical protein
MGRLLSGCRTYDDMAKLQAVIYKMEPECGESGWMCEALICARVAATQNLRTPILDPKYSQICNIRSGKQSQFVSDHG